MEIGVIGINKKSSPLAEREKITEAFQKIKKEGVFLSTCNRTEIYFSSNDLPALHHEILTRLRAEISTPFEHLLYSYFRRDCFFHLGRVVSGLDSAIVGESDIQRQVKLAYENTREMHALDSYLHFLFQKGLKVGKEFRSSFLMPPKTMGLAEATYELALQTKGRVLFIGNSHLNRQILRYFLFRKREDLTLWSRKEYFEGEWRAYDVVIVATKHPGYLLTGKRLDHQLIIDLSMPRNVDPALGNYNLEEVEAYISQKRSLPLLHLDQCEKVVGELIDRQISLFHRRRSRKVHYDKVHPLPVHCMAH